MHRIVAGGAQGSRKRGRKLSVDDEQQDLFRGNNWMVRLTRCERERGIDIRAFEIRDSREGSPPATSHSTASPGCQTQ
jgi:hypothetical protein